MTDALQVPFFLPDGKSLLMDSDFMRRLREGDATIGWTGDPRLGVYHADDCIEIHRLCEDGEVRLIMRSKPGVTSLGSEALRFLAEHDTQSRRAYDPVEEINRHNAGVEKSIADREKDRRGEAAERLAWALRRDLGYHYGITSRAYYPGVDVPKADQ